MKANYFVKQSYKNTKIALMTVFTVLSAIVIILNIKFQMIYWWLFISLGVILLIFICLIKLFDSFGIYITEDKVFYKRIKTKQIDVNSITGIKVIKSEMRTNLAWSSFELKDKQGDNLYSAIYLSKIDFDMKDYPYGDIEFIRRFKNDVVMHSIYDKRFIEDLKQFNNEIEII